MVARVMGGSLKIGDNEGKDVETCLRLIEGRC